jgi:hypothetical protein
MQEKLFSATEVARKLGVLPREIPDLFYQGRLDHSACPSVGGRRMIPASFIPTIRKAIRERKKIKRK